jgi:outer membrane protein assembly factor BamB
MPLPIAPSRPLPGTRTLHLVLVAAAPLWLVPAGPGRATPPWPEFRGPRGNGQATVSRVPTAWSEGENVAWKTAIHDRGWSSPVVGPGGIWLTTARQDGTKLFLVCVDLQSGDVRHDLLLFRVGEPREIHKLNTYASPTPVIEQDRVYAHFGSYGTACVDALTAKVLWQRRDLPCNHWRGPGSSPIVFQDLLIVHYDGYDYQYVVALDKRTGHTVWKRDRQIDYGTDDGDIMKAFCTPVVFRVAGQWQLVSPTSKATIAYDPLTGREIWRVRYAGFSATARPVLDGGLVFLNTGFSKAHLLAVRTDGRGDVTDSHVAWRRTKLVGSKPSPLLVDGLLYLLHDTGVLCCLEARSGREIWTRRLGGNFSASPVSAAGLAFFCNQEGETTVIRPGRRFEQVAVNVLDDGCLASPAVVEGALLLRTATHLYRIEDRSARRRQAE